MKKNIAQRPVRVLLILVLLVALSAPKVNAVAVSLEIHRDHASGTTPFQVSNMLPGDTQTQTYCLAVSYRGSITLNFHGDIRDGYEKLAEVLKCRVCLGDGTLLYDGLMGDMPAAIPVELKDGGSGEIEYAITAYLDTSVGNDYMGKALYADLRWWVNVDSDGDQSGSLTPPKTGDEARLGLWAGLVAASLMGCLLVVRSRKADGREPHE